MSVWRMSRAFVVGALATISVCECRVVRAQGTAGDKPAMMAKDADPDWEVVTVKQRDPYTKSDYIDAHGRHVAFQNETVENLLWFGYSVQKNQIADAPEWATTERWDVDGLADVGGEPNVAQLQALARKVLAERFGLKLHREQREMPVFSLNVAKGGPKLAKSTSDPNGHPSEHGSAAGVGWHTYAFTNTSMPVFVLDILGYVDRPSVDQTGLKGRYDFQLKWLTDENHATDPDAPPGLFTAVQEQLGLKLEPVKAKADVLVVDKVERPGAN